MQHLNFMNQPNFAFHSLHETNESSSFNFFCSKIKTNTSSLEPELEQQSRAHCTPLDLHYLPQLSVQHLKCKGASRFVSYYSGEQTEAPN